MTLLWINSILKEASFLNTFVPCIWSFPSWDKKRNNLVRNWKYRKTCKSYYKFCKLNISGERVGMKIHIRIRNVLKGVSRKPTIGSKWIHWGVSCDHPHTTQRKRSKWKQPVFNCIFEKEKKPVHVDITSYPPILWYFSLGH